MNSQIWTAPENKALTSPQRGFFKGLGTDVAEMAMVAKTSMHKPAESATR